MNFALKPKLEALVRKKVKSGMYESADDVLYEALRLLDERDADRLAKLASLRKDLAHGVDQLNAGLGRKLNVDAIKKSGRRALAARKRKRK